MTLNGVNSTLHTSQLEYIPYYSNNQYKVQLKNLALNDKQIILKDQDFPTIIDSGTTLTYFPKTIFQSIEEKIKSFCLETNRCLGKLKKTDSGMCFEPNENINFVQLVESMPTLNFEFENFVNYEWSPYNYLYEDLDDDNVQYCMGFDTWTSNAIVLGTTWMHNHDIIFDLDKKRIGFALANCNNDKQTSEINRQKYYNNCYKEIATYKKILLSLIAFIIIGFILVSIAISRLRDGKPLLWSRVSSILVEKEMSIIVIKH